MRRHGALWTPATLAGRSATARLQPTHGRHYTSEGSRHQSKLDKIKAAALFAKAEQDARIARATKLGIAAYAVAHGVPLEGMHANEIGLDDTINFMIAELAAA